MRLHKILEEVHIHLGIRLAGNSAERGCGRLEVLQFLPILTETQDVEYRGRICGKLARLE
jgi:hypothetical protein